MKNESKSTTPAPAVTPAAPTTNPAPNPAPRRRIRRQLDLTHPLKHHPSVLLGHESADSFQFVRQSVNDEFNPNSNYQQLLSELAAQNVWRTLRSAAIESAAIDTELADQTTQVDRDYEDIDDECRTYLAFREPAFAHVKREIKDDETVYTRRHFLVAGHIKPGKRK